MKKLAAVAIVLLSWSRSSLADDVRPPASAPAAEPAPPADAARPRPAPPWKLPPCAEPEGEGAFVSSTGCSGVFGVRGSAIGVRGVRAEEGTGIMFSGEGEEFVRRGIFNSHGLHRVAIGGGGAGFEGTLVGNMTAGFRIPFGDRHGPVVRAGAFGYLRGNDAFYASLFELPELELGYQYLRGTTIIELGATTGAVLIGRQRIGEAETRHLGSGLEIGAYAAIQVPWVRLGMRATRLPTNDGVESPVRVAEGTLCILAAPFAVCGDARAMTTDAVTAPGAAPSEVSSLYGGLAFGFTRER
jgi:hypothetical protein